MKCAALAAVAYISDLILELSFFDSIVAVLDKLHVRCRAPQRSPPPR
jgi:hypothetical protein